MHDYNNTQVYFLVNTNTAHIVKECKILTASRSTAEPRTSCVFALPVPASPNQAFINLVDITRLFQGSSRPSDTART